MCVGFVAQPLRLDPGGCAPWPAPNRPPSRSKRAALVRALPLYDPPWPSAEGPAVCAAPPAALQAEQMLRDYDEAFKELEATLPDPCRDTGACEGWRGWSRPGRAQHERLICCSSFAAQLSCTLLVCAACRRTLPALGGSGRVREEPGGLPLLQRRSRLCLLRGRKWCLASSELLAHRPDLTALPPSQPHAGFYV